MSVINKIKRLYKSIRTRDLTFKFSCRDVRHTEYAYESGDNSIPTSKYYDKSRRPNNKYDRKGAVDDYSIKLFNEIMGDEYFVNSLDQIKQKSQDYIEWYNSSTDFGLLAQDSDNMRFITAFSASAFGGIQYAETSTIAFDSMIKSLESHNSSIAKKRDWVWDIVRSKLSTHLNVHKHITKRSVADAMISAKQSSSSIPKVAKYRDWLFTTSWQEILDFINSDMVEFVYWIGVRNDRRSKFRMICSMSGHIRVIDFILTNGSYDICEGDGIWSSFTTEGMNNKKMYPEMKKMCADGDYVSVCIDFSGYDSQIHKLDYVEFVKVLTDPHADDVELMKLKSFFIDWLKQPKPLCFRSHDGRPEVIIDNYRTLASGHHGTHSIENFIGIATYYYMKENLGFRIKLYKTNGDDQNFLIHHKDVDAAMNWLNGEFDLSIPKSLVGHQLCVWSKHWFTKHYHPAPEIGTFRSIWERESSGINVVEPSKLASNYGKMIQVAIVLHRLGKSKRIIRNWLLELGSECDPIIDPDRLPIDLEAYLQIKQSSSTISSPATGLEEQKHTLAKRAFPYKMLDVPNFYEMLYTLYRDRSYYDLQPGGIEYYPQGTTLQIKRSYDYSIDSVEGDSWLYRSLSKFIFTETKEDRLIRCVLQSSNSNDGPCSVEYQFDDMITLAISINDRNRRIWNQI